MDVFVGRERELELADRAIERASRGEGAVLLFTGPAGIGKTALAGVVAQRAAKVGSRVAWGRAWEAGGAPAYWPWMQIFRALGEGDPFMVTAESDDPQARFAAFDRASTRLRALATDTMLTLVLDDLHVADPSTLLCLQFVARNLAGSRLLVIGTYREAEARLAGEIGVALTKVAREAEHVSLPALSREDVSAWAAAAAIEGADEVFAASEGNALFVREMVRAAAETPAWRARARDVSVADGLRNILDEHLARVSATTRDVLAVASVLGRDVDPELVARLANRTRDDIEPALREAASAGLLESLYGGDRLSFSHILHRERLYGSLMPSARSALHLRAAEELLAAKADLATALHHLLLGEPPAERVAEVVVAAARAAIGKLAFEDAVRYCDQALARHTADDVITLEIELLRGEALLRVGRAAEGRDACVVCAERADRVGSPEHYARAALVYATELAVGMVEPRMVMLLKSALARLPETETALRARLVARYSGSLSPAWTPETMHELRTRGEEAIAMARRLGDPETLLFALQHGGSSAAYGLPASQRLALRGEIVELTERLGRAPLQIMGWWIGSLREYGRCADAEAAVDRYARYLAAYALPYYRWRLPHLRATLASIDGDYEGAVRLAEEAAVLADEAGSKPSGGALRAIHRVSIAVMSGDMRWLGSEPDREVLHAAFQNDSKFFFGYDGILLAMQGSVDEARARCEKMLELRFAFAWVLIGSILAVTLGDRALAERAYPMIEPHLGEQVMMWGPLGGPAFGPAVRVAGDLAMLLGREDDARRHWLEALAIGKRMEAAGIVASVERRLASLGGPKPEAVVAPRSKVEVTMSRDGDTWRIVSTSGEVLMKHTKGLQYLAELVARPRVALHVMELVGDDVPVGEGQAVLDPRAKHAYGERARALKEGLDEARSFNDIARVSKIEAELEAIADELAAAVGLGGRDRKMGSVAERMRINVQRRLKDALQRIAEQNPALGRYLGATVKTGIFCAYEPL